MVYAFWHVEESTWVTLNLADVQKRRDKLKVGPTHEKVWAALRWHENSQEERSWHMGRQETRWKELRCEVWRVQCDVWGKCLLDVALHRGRAQVMFLDNNIATASHKARMHRPGWRTAHASSFVVVLGRDSWKLRWHMTLDKVRRAQMRWSVECEECSVKCGGWRVQCEVWSVKFGVWRKQWEVRSVDCEVWSVDCEVWSLECEECSVTCEVWSVMCGVWSVKCGVLRVQCEVCSVECEDCQVRSAKWSFKCDMWNKTPVSHKARTHGPGWRTAHASSIDEKGLIYIFKATSAPPRAGTTGIEHVCIYIYIYIFNISLRDIIYI